MAWREYDLAQGKFLIDLDVIVQIVKAYYRAEYRAKFSREVKQSQWEFFSPTTYGLPDLTFYETDWEAVKREMLTVDFTIIVMLGFAALKSDGMTQMMQQLRQWQTVTRTLNARYATNMRKASDKSKSDIERSINGVQPWLTGATYTRDISASILVGAGVVATGGAAAVGLVGGIGLKGIAKYQDTGRVGSAAVEVAQQVVFTVVPLTKIPGAGALKSAAGQVANVLVSTTADGVNAYLDGKSVATAAMVGAVNLPVKGIDAAAKKLVGKVAVPVAARFGNIQTEVALGAVKKVFVDQSKKQGQNYIKKASSGSDSMNGMQVDADKFIKRTDSVLDAMTMGEEMYLRAAALKMDPRDGALSMGWW